MSKQQEIINMFDEIAPSYDRANRVLSFGIDSSWRKYALNQIKNKLNSLNITSPIIYDIACGTGDMCELLSSIEGSKVYGIDPSSGMLEVAKKRFSNQQEINFIQAQAAQIPMPTNSADVLTISYGFRNVVDKQNALKEFNRVLKPGGTLCVLEFCRREKGGLISACRDFYLSKILPSLGGLISHNKAAYEYLPASIDDFYSPNEFISELERFGFSDINYKSFSFGVSYMFLATCKQQ